MILEKDTMKAIDYAEAGCRSMMREFSAEDLPPKGRFHYHQGVFLSGMYQCYELTQKQYYFDYIKAWVDSIINEKGEIHSFCPDELDDIQPGILLFPLAEKTGDPRYDTALFTYAILRGIRAGYLPEQYLQNGERGYRGLIQTVKFEDGELVLDGICVGTCVGDYNFYVQRPTCANDLHGMGAFLLMCSERARCTALGE